jgi:hypothetical protein
MLLGIPFLKQIIGVVIGAALGFAYWRFIGCASGTCPITSNPWISTSYGAVIGLLFTY